MSLVPRDEMTTLRSASASKATADTALDEQQLMEVAYLINNAANTGEYTAIYQNKLRDATVEALESSGYTIKYVHNNAYDMKKHAMIIWRDTKDGDLVPEPSNSGPKYNTKEDDEVQEEEGGSEGLDQDPENPEGGLEEDFTEEEGSW